jgi:hypothetical protein
MNATNITDKDDRYVNLVQQIRNDLRLQHPDWIQPNGQCPMCDSYEARLMELLAGSRRDLPNQPQFSRTKL